MKFMLLIFGLGLLFGYVSVYASLTRTSYSRSELMTQFRQEKIRNERLKVEYVRHSSPQYVMNAANSAGMVYATDYDYLRKPQRVASIAGRNQ